MLGDIPLYSASTPSFLTMEWTQWIAPKYWGVLPNELLAFSNPCTCVMIAHDKKRMYHNIATKTLNA